MPTEDERDVSFEEANQLVQEVRDQYVSDAVDGDPQAVAAFREANIVWQLVGVLKRVRMSPGDWAILSARLHTLKGLAKCGRHAERISEIRVVQQDEAQFPGQLLLRDSSSKLEAK